MKWFELFVRVLDRVADTFFICAISSLYALADRASLFWLFVLIGSAAIMAVCYRQVDYLVEWKWSGRDDLLYLKKEPPPWLNRYVSPRRHFPIARTVIDFF